MNGLLALWGVLTVAAPMGDTMVELRRGDRVVVENLSGELRVEVGGRPELALIGDEDELEEVAFSRAGSQVRVHSGSRKGRRGEVDLTLRVPEWVELEVRGRSLEVDISGVQGAVFVRNVEGDISVHDVGGGVELNTQEGEILARGVRGSIQARSRGDDVRLVDVVGDVDVETGSGSLTLDGIEARNLRAKSLDGDLRFRGPFLADGRYTFSVHDGDATLVLPDGSGARVSVATFEGDFESDFPVVVEGYKGGGAFAFTLGGGGAQVEVKVFDGEIRLLRAEGR